MNHQPSTPDPDSHKPPPQIRAHPDTHPQDPTDDQYPNRNEAQHAHTNPDRRSPRLLTPRHPRPARKHQRPPTIATTDTLRDAITHTQKLQPDVTLLGLILNPTDLKTAITNLHQASPKTKIIILGLNTDPTYHQAAITAGATDYLPKDTIHQNLANTIQNVMSTSPNPTPVRPTL